MQNLLIFGVIIVIIALASDRLLTKKYNIKKEKGLYSHVNKLHKWGEISFIVATFVLLFIFNFVLDITGSLKPGHYILAFIPAFIFRIFMEYRHERDSKRYLRSILSVIIFFILFVGIELLFYNPVPVRLEVDQVKEITIENYSESEDLHTIALTDRDLIIQILSTIGEGGFQDGTYPVEPRLKMTIKQSDGREIVIKESIYRNGVFMIHTERFLFPSDMMLFSQDLQLIFEDIADTLK